MKTIKAIISIVPLLILLSCEKMYQPDKDANWWVRRAFDYTGIKTIESGDYVIYGDGSRLNYGIAHKSYNRNGTLASVHSETYDASYAYNPDGTIQTSLIIYKYETPYTYSVAYEYDNPGRFVPVILNPKEPFSLHVDGLTPNLSKITVTENGEISTRVVYTFESDDLTITISKKGKEAYEPIVVEYRGAYPYQCHTDQFFFGPITYQENGMFDTVREGSLKDGQVTQECTYSFLKGRSDKMLMERQMDNYYVTAYSYNEYGDCIEIKYGEAGGKELYVSMTAEYEYDARGNWTNKKSKHLDNIWSGLKQQAPQYQVIEYY